MIEFITYLYLNHQTNKKFNTNRINIKNISSNIFRSLAYQQHEEFWVESSIF